MRKVVINSGGLGDVAANVAGALTSSGPSLTSPGWANACGLSFPSYLFNPECWGESYSAWSNAFYGNLPAPPAPAAVGTPADLVSPGPPDTTGSTSQDLSNAAITATQGANQNFFSNVAVQGGSPSASVLCSFFDCDASGNLTLSATNLMWVAGLAFGGLLLVKLL